MSTRDPTSGHASEKMSPTSGRYSRSTSASIASASPMSDTSSTETLTMSTYEDPFSDDLAVESPVLPSTTYQDAGVEQGLSVTLPAQDQIHADKYGDRANRYGDSSASITSIWSRRHQSLRSNESPRQVANGRAVYDKYDHSAHVDQGSEKSSLGSPFQYIAGESRGTSQQIAVDRRQSYSNHIPGKIFGSGKATTAHRTAQKNAAEPKQEMQADFAKLSIGAASQAQTKQGAAPVGGSFRRLGQRYSQMFSRPASAKEEPVIMYEVPKQHRRAVRDILQDYTHMTLPTPYFIILTDASCTVEKLSAGQLDETGVINPHTGLLRYVPRFSGALLTVLTYDRDGSNVSDQGAKTAARVLKPLELSHVLQRRMFDGASILVPDSYSPWTQLDVLAIHNPRLVKRITRALADGETFAATDFLNSTALPQPLPQSVARILVYEAQISAARHSNRHSMRKLDSRDRNHVYNGWLALLEASLQGRSQSEPDVEQLQKKNKLFELQFLRDKHLTVCTAMKSQFEGHVQRRLDGSIQR